MNATDLHKILQTALDPVESTEQLIQSKKDFRKLIALWQCEAECVENCLYFSPTGTGECGFRVQLDSICICIKVV